MSCHASYNPISHKEKLVWLRISKWYYNIIFQQKLVKKKEKKWNTCCITLFGNNGFISSIKHLLCALRYICIYKSFLFIKFGKFLWKIKTFPSACFLSKYYGYEHRTQRSYYQQIWSARHNYIKKSKELPIWWSNYYKIRLEKYLNEVAHLNNSSMVIDKQF